MARPDLWRVDFCKPSKATSSTSPWVCLVHHLAHGPEAGDGVVAHEAVDAQKLLVGEAEIGLADRHQLLALRARRPDAEGVVGIKRGALAVAALGIHQHGVDQKRVALPLPPRPLRPAGEVGGVAPLEHHPLDRLGVGSGAGGGRVGAGGGKLLPGGEGHERRKLNSRIANRVNKGLKPASTCLEGQASKVRFALREEVVGAQAGGVVGEEFGGDACRLSRCWSTLNDCTRPSRTIRSSPSIAPGSRRASIRSGKALVISSPVRE